MGLRRGMMLGVVLALWGAAPAPADVWLGGDGHVHTCYSHDSWCPEGDTNSGPDVFYSSFARVDQRFVEAAGKGLDFLVISDHDDTRAWEDPAFGSQGVLGVHAYESSVRGGHAQMIGAKRHYDEGSRTGIDGAALDLNDQAAAIEADGGFLQANHPSYRADRGVESCEEMELSQWNTNPMHWRYGFSVAPRSIEVWNPTALIPPAELYWECWLQRGYRVPAMAGSDSHGGNQLNLGVPTVWVNAVERTEAAIVDAIKAGRTTISRRPPLHGGMRLLLEGRVDGEWTARIGDTVAPGTRMRVRAEGLDSAGLVRVRANGQTLLEGEVLTPATPVEFTAPDQAGWVRATLLGAPQATGASNPACRPGMLSARSPIDLCADDLVITAMTSPIYLGATKAAKRAKRLRGARGHAHLEEPHEVDDLRPLDELTNSLGGRDLPHVERVRRSGETLAR